MHWIKIYMFLNRMHMQDMFVQNQHAILIVYIVHTLHFVPLDTQYA